MAGHCKRLQWNDSYRTGDSALDDQHLTAVLLYNDVMRALEGRASPHMVAETIDTLISFLRTHFAWEERHMTAQGLRHARERTVRNARFEVVAQAFYQYLGLSDSGESFVAFVGEWIVEHMLVDHGPAAEGSGD